MKMLLALKKYREMYSIYLGNGIYFVIFLTMVAAILEGFGIMLLFPLFEIAMLNGDASFSIDKSSLLMKYFLLSFNFTGLELTLVNLTLVIFLLFSIKAIVVYAVYTLVANFVGILLSRIKSDTIIEIGNIDYLSFSKYSQGELISLVNDQSNRAVIAFYHLMQFYSQASSAILYLIIIFGISLSFGFTSSICGVLIVWILKGFSTKALAYSRQTAKVSASVSSQCVEFLSGFKYLSATNTYQTLMTRPQTSIQTLGDLEFRTGRLRGFVKALKEPLALAALLTISSVQVIAFGTSVGELVVLIVLLYRALSAFLTLQGNWQNTSETIGATELIFDRLEKMRAFSQTDAIIDPKVPYTHGDISLQNVSYGYAEKTPVLNDVSLNIPQNTMVAFVGKSGQGKTTLADVITGVIKPSFGNITYNNISSAKIQAETIKNAVGYVTQHAWLIKGSIYQNITLDFSDSEPSVEQKARVTECLEAAELLPFVASLPDGIFSQLGDQGSGLSGGERQRLTLARELYRNPKLLILDEATSALDQVAESEIRKSLKKIKGSLTVIIISHRPSTVRDADQIYMINKGSIAEVGTFEELMSRSEHFAKLMK